MKSKTFRVLVVLMAILLIGGMMASCKKNKPVKTEKISKTILGDWDYMHYLDENNAGVYHYPSTPQDDNRDGVADYKFYETGEGIQYMFNQDWRIKWSIEGDQMTVRHWNYVQDDWGTSQGTPQDILMPHKDTVYFKNKLYVRM